MFLSLSLLACNPHNPDDLAKIADLNSTLNHRAVDLGQVTAQLESAKDDLYGYKVVAAHYANDHKFTGNSLVVCHDKNAFTKVSLTFPGTPRPAWIQAVSSKDCGDPQVLSYDAPPVSNSVATELEFPTHHKGGMTMMF